MIGRDLWFDRGLSEWIEYSLSFDRIRGDIFFAGLSQRENLPCLARFLRRNSDPRCFFGRLRITPFLLILCNDNEQGNRPRLQGFGAK